MSDQKNSPSMFSKENYTWMLIGIVVIALGMFLMSGGTSNKDPNVFDKDAVYSARRISIAPLLILAGPRNSYIDRITSCNKNPSKRENH